MTKRVSPRLSQKDAGAYFTPTDVAGSLVAWALRSPDDRLLDPSCGDGQFLALHRNSVGIEQDPISAHEAIAQAPWSLIHEGDFFAWALATSERFDCAAGNPPFIRYQTFKGEVRRQALALCSALGVEFNGLASSWAPFLVATTALLKPGGRMAFIVPAEIGHAPYAIPLLEYLVTSFAQVRIIAVRKKLFPDLSEDCWLLYADGYGGRAPHLDLAVIDYFKPSKQPPKATVEVDLDEWRQVWNRRLRPYLLPTSVRSLYRSVAEDPESRRFGDFASIGIGYVSGDNDFFHLRPSDAKRWHIPSDYLYPSLRNGRAMPDKQITKSTVQSWHIHDEQAFLLRLNPQQELPLAIMRYLDSSAGKQAQLRYKCRNRKPWYVVPDVQVPDFIMSYMSGRSINLVRNSAGVTCTNSVHSVRLLQPKLATECLPQWTSPFVRVSCELEGHALGGGMLKVEPREASRILFPRHREFSKSAVSLMEEAIETLQSWRHYAS